MNSYDFLRSFNIQDVGNDANCLVRSLSVCIYHTEVKYSEIRGKVFKHVANNWVNYKSFIVSDESDGIPINEVED